MALSGALAVCATLTFLLTGTAGRSGCHTAVESLDLGCLLRWDCPGASPNAAYTVHTKTQGDPWQQVAWCVQISSRSCDLSQAFSDFDLYHMIRLAVHHDVTGSAPPTTAWSEPLKFDYSDFAFSAPSVSLALESDRLRVRVQFPCAANRRCSRGTCCPLSVFIDPWTSVTVYNKLNPSDRQRRTVWSQDAESEVEFSDLAPGQHYCAVANFSFPSYTIAASPPSPPQCIHTDPPTGPEWWLVLGAVLCCVAMAPVSILLLLRTKRRASPEHPPKTPPETEASPRAPPISPCDLDPCDVHLELVDAHVVPSCSSSSSPSALQLPLVGLSPGLGPGLPGPGEVAVIWNQDQIQLHTPEIPVITH